MKGREITASAQRDKSERKSRDKRYFKVCEVEYGGVVSVRGGERRTRGEGEGMSGVTIRGEVV